MAEDAGEDAAASSSAAAAPSAEESSSASGAAPSGTDGPAQKGGNADINSFRISMRKAMKDREYEKVLILYDEMVMNGVKPDTLTLNYLVEAKGLTANTAQARELLEVLLSTHKGAKPPLEATAQTYASLVRSCEASADMPTARALYEEALGKGVAMHQDLFNALITVYTAAKSFGDAEGLFAEMRLKGVRPSSATYLKFIYACFGQREAGKAYEMLVNMENEWRVPDRKEYTRMMRQFKLCGHSEGKQRCFKGLILDHKNSPNSPLGRESLDSEVVTSLFKEAQDKKQYDEIVELANTLRAAGGRLDRYQTVALVDAHVRTGNSVEAFAVATSLYASGMYLPFEFHERLLNELGHDAAAVDETYYLLESRKQKSKVVPLPMVNMVIEACALLSDLDRAFATWAELEQFDLQADAGTYNALLHTCIRTRELASGRRLLTRMTQDGIEPTADTFMHRLTMHIMSREDKLAEQVLKECKEAQLRPPAKMYITMLNSHIRARRFEQAEQTLTDMAADKHMVGPGLRKRITDAKQQAGY